MRSLIGFILIFAIGLSLPFVYAQAFTSSELEAINARLAEANADVQLNAEEALALIQIANDATLDFIGSGNQLLVNHNFQGTDSEAFTFSSRSWFEYCINYQDGSECGTTQQLSPSFVSFTAFDNTPLFSFTDIADPLRTLIDAEVRTVTDFTDIGTSFCHDAPRWKISQQISVNGVDVKIPRQLFGMLEFDQGTHIMKNIGVKFTPQLVERLLEDAGVDLRTGDRIKWVIIGEYRYTVWKGTIVQFNTDEGNVCSVTGELAFDGYGSGARIVMDFQYVDAFDQIARPTTTLPDTDGDGIPDIDDQCSFTRETFNGIDDEDGCPDTDPSAPPLPFELQDADFDGIVNGDDDCIYLAENFNGIQDGDGCPDGQSIENVFVPLGETQEIFLPAVELEPLITSEELQSGVSPAQEQIIEENLVEDNPETNFTEGMGVVITGDDPVPVQYCNNLVTDCNTVIARATSFVSMTTGLPLPFEPTILNLIIFFAIISVVMIIFVKFVVNKRR